MLLMQSNASFAKAARILNMTNYLFASGYFPIQICPRFFINTLAEPRNKRTTKNAWSGKKSKHIPSSINVNARRRLLC
jgi:hypothetical protein